MYPFYAWHEWYVAHMKTKSHKSIYKCILFFVKKNSDLCCDKKILIWFKKIGSVFVYVKKKVFGEEKNQICFIK